MGYSQLPLVTAVDVPSWKRLGALWLLAVIATAYFVVMGARLDDDLPLAAILTVLLLPLQRIYGSRTLELFTERLRVTRRGKVRLDVELVALRQIIHIPFTDVYWLWFGGTRFVFIPANAHSFCRLLDHVKAL